MTGAGSGLMDRRKKLDEIIYSNKGLILFSDSFNYILN
jgi:hypothetical protein